MGRLINNFKKYKFLLNELVKKEIKLKYRSSYLGFVWTMLEPLLSMMVLAVVFSSLKGNGDKTFPVYILTGRLVVTFFSMATKLAIKSIRSNASMIKKVYVPKYIYPLSTIFSSYITFLLSLVVLVVVSAVFKVKPTVYLLCSVVPLFLLLVLATGVGLIVATLAVFFRDTEYLWGVIMMLLHYCSAVFYKPKSVVKRGYGWIFDYNPLYAVIRNFRNSVLYGKPLHAPSMIYLTIVSFSALIIGLVVFYKKQDDFILYI